jgi:fumarate reductase subunit C
MYRTATWENSTTSVGTLLLVLALVLDVVLLDEAGMEVVVAFAADPVLVALAAAALS